MNFEAWQSQQKAQKEEERKRQKAAAEALQGYRGGVSAEDAKLSVLREEERKKKLEAEERLRGYRGTLSEEEKKLLALREAERQQRSLQNWGSISGGLDASLPELVTPSKNTNPSDAIIPGSVSAMADKFKAENGSTNLEALTGNSNKPMMNGASDSANENLPTLNGSNDPAVGMFDHNNTTNDNILATPTVEINTIESPQQVVAEFYFGLITESARPDLEAYMSSVSAVIKSLASRDSTVADKVLFETPKVKKVKTDDKYIDPEGRNMVKRLLVTVSIEFATKGLVNGNDVKEKIVSCVREAVQNGSFRL